MKRRELLTLIGGAAAAWPLAAWAQQAQKMRRIGVLMHLALDDPEGQRRVAAFLQGLQEAGLAVGRNVDIDVRWAAGEADRFPRYAAELIALGPDHPGVRHAECSGRAAGNPHGADRFRIGPRCGRQRSCR
jgi:putative ABC transport system substrate-binding protein